MKLTQASITILAAIITATDANGENTGNGFVAANYPAGKALIDAQLIEVNENLKNDSGEFGARPTAKGREYAKTGKIEGEEGNADAGTASGAAAASTPARKTYAVETGIALPGKTRAPVASSYPFDSLVIGGSFFVSDADVKSGDAFKSLQSTVNGANARHAVETGEFRPNRKDATKQVAVTKQNRQFELRRWVQEDGTKGARVFEVAVDNA